jgi:hypothetical protein
MKTYLALLLFLVSVTSYSGSIHYVYLGVEPGSAWYDLNNGATIYGNTNAGVAWSYTLSPYPYMGLYTVKVWVDGTQLPDGSNPVNAAVGNHTYRVELWENYVLGGQYNTATAQISFSVVPAYQVTVKNNFSGGAVTMDGAQWTFSNSPYGNPWYGYVTTDFIIRTWGQNTTHTLAGINNQTVNNLLRSWQKWTIGVIDYSDISHNHTVAGEITCQANYYTQPTVPQNLHVANSSGIVQLQWTANSESDLSSYEISRDRSPYGNWTVIGNPTSNSFRDEYESLWQNGPVDLHYRIRAQNTHGMFSNYSDYISCSAHPLEKRPGGLTAEVPLQDELRQNYPNPFNPETEIAYQLKKGGHTHLVIFDLLGREVAMLVNGEQQSGYYSVHWNAANASSGIYVCQLIISDGSGKAPFFETRKMQLMK